MDFLQKTKNYFVAVSLFSAIALINAKPANAQDITCTVVYGQGEVCGVATTEEPVVEHEPVVAGVGDIDFRKTALLIGFAGAALFLLSQFSKRIYFLDR
jgi:hypothetical protein